MLHVGPSIPASRAALAGFSTPVLAFLVLLGSCSGMIVDSTGSTRQDTERSPPYAKGGAAGQPGMLPPAPAPASPGGPGPSPLRRLTRHEYDHTLRDLLGIDSRPSSDFPADAVGPSGFYNPGGVSSVEVERLLGASESIGSRVSAELPGLVACDAASAGEETCVRRFVTRFGRRAYRRPLETNEIEGLVASFKSLKDSLKYPFLEAVRTLVQAMLQSPHFLYHRESAGKARLEGGVVRFDGHAMASRLSYFLWTTMPDEALFAAADQGRLQTLGDMDREARRMIADPKFRDTVASFHSQWLGLDEDLYTLPKDTKRFPMWTRALAAAMQREPVEFASHVLGSEGDGRLGTLLTAPFSFVNADLAALYGIPGAVAGAKFQRADLPAAQRAGLLTQAGYLARGATNSQPLPPVRGMNILQGFLCGKVPPPPDDAPSAPPATSGVTNRQRFETHLKNACAAACHGVIDPLGFAFENYDAIGAYRTQDAGQTVDASGAVSLSPGAPPTAFRNAIDLIGAMAGNGDLRRCVARHWFRFAVNREEIPTDTAFLESIDAAFARSGGDVRDLVVEMTKGSSFLFRAPAQGEVFQ